MQGINLNLTDYNFDASKYRYLLLITHDSGGDTDATVLIPINNDFNSSIQYEWSYTYTSDNVVTYVVDDYHRTVYFRPSTGVFQVNSCVNRHDLYSEAEYTFNYQTDNSKLIPYQIWGIM